ncbi:MAG: hypothetical protein ACKVU2_12605, partial [Saprospiraceae bacterium]
GRAIWAAFCVARQLRSPIKAQAKHVHAIVVHLQTLPPKSIRVLEPTLAHFVSIISSFRYLGEAKA